MADLSIIVPIYNDEEYLQQTIDSLLASKCNMEIILVDDGSTDKSLAICERYSTLQNVKIIHKKNGGLPSARKAGVKEATGTYIGFLDGDDWVDDNYYSYMIEKAKEFNTDLVCSSLVFSYPDREIQAKELFEDGLYSKNDLGNLKNKALYTEPYYTYGIAPSLCTKIIRKSILEPYLNRVPNNITLAEDAVCTYPILFSCDNLYFIGSNCGYHYRQNEKSMTKVYDPIKKDRILTAMKYFSSVMEQQFEFYDYQIYKFFSYLIKDEIRNEVKNSGNNKAIKTALSQFREEKIVKLTLDNLNGIPLKYQFLFQLYKYRMYSILIFIMRLI